VGRSVDERTLLKLELMIQRWECYLDSSSSGWGPMAGSYKLSGSVQAEYFFYPLTQYILLKIYHAQRSKLVS